MNPLLVPSPLPYGFPDFDAIAEEHFVEAFAVGMAEQRAEVDAITTRPVAPTFDDTVVALERSGATLRRVSAVFSTLVASLSTPGVRAIEAELAPRLAAHADAITLDPALFARLDALHAVRHDLDLDPESLRLLERRHRDAVRSGARLDAGEQERLRALNAELSALTAEFGSRLLADTNDAAVVVDDAARLDGLAPDAVSAAARAAEARGLPGRFALPLVLPTGQPALAVLTDRDLRERLFRAAVSRGARGGPHDTRDLVRRITALRAERAGLLGHPHHASWVVEVGTAGTVEAVEALLAALVAPAVRNAEAEAAALADVAGHPVEPWDRAFYAERVRRDSAFDAAALRPYLELERVLHDGVFAAAEELYGLTFTERHDLPTYHPDVRVFHVEHRGEPSGLFVLDAYARETKRGGAWMNSFAVQSRLLGTRPVVLNTLNLTRPASGPTLLTVAEVTTAFHEFGHALHGLLSDVAYPTFAGTGVPRDVVEFPSQVNEAWLRDPAIVARYARHHGTGAPLPAELAAGLTDRTPAFGAGWATTEYLAAALLDLAWHRLAPGEQVDDVEAFEAAALAAAGVALPSVPPRYRSAYFNHVFSGDYSAAYYAYIWAEVLDADAVEWFAEHGGLRRDNGEAFRRAVLSRGGSVDPMQAYREFRGRDPEIAPLLARRGLD
ncbi:MAG TPA: M3 family metallopeptidase [Pseudonocardia sp.]